MNELEVDDDDDDDNSDVKKLVRELTLIYSNLQRSVFRVIYYREVQAILSKPKSYLLISA